MKVFGQEKDVGRLHNILSEHRSLVKRLTTVATRREGVPGFNDYHNVEKERKKHGGGILKLQTLNFGVRKQRVT